MRIDRAQMKADAKASMRAQKRPSVYVFTLVFLVIVWVLEALAMRMSMPKISRSQL